jgi:hypothetical protein
MHSPMQATVVIIASAYEFSAKLVFDMNANDIIEGFFGSGETQLERPIGHKITRPSSHDPMMV